MNLTPFLTNKIIFKVYYALTHLTYIICSRGQWTSNMADKEDQNQLLFFDTFTHENSEVGNHAPNYKVQYEGKHDRQPVCSVITAYLPTYSPR